MNTTLRTLLAAATLLALSALPAHAQRTSGAVGLGGQIGEPTGITLKIYNANAPSYDFLAAWDLDDFFFLNAHALFAERLNASNIEPELELFYGPGAFIGIFDNPVDDEVGLGISGTVGVGVLFSQQVELYGQVTPRIGLVPDTDGEVGGGIGVRYYF
jgi:hypothetical protein